MKKLLKYSRACLEVSRMATVYGGKHNRYRKDSELTCQMATVNRGKCLIYSRAQNMNLD